MKKLKSNEIHFVSGGFSQYDAVDIVSTSVGMVTLRALAHQTLRSTSGINAYIMICIDAVVIIAGGYVGYSIGQYIKRGK